MQSDISQILSGDFSSLGGDIEKIAQDSFGELGIPDIEVMEQEIDSSDEEDLTPISQALGVLTGGEDSSSALKENLKTSLSANITQAIANESTLGKEAQWKLNQKAQLAAEANDTSKQLSEEAQDTDVTQHIMQGISAQIAEQQKSSTLLLAEAQKARQDRALNNVITSKALKELNGANLAESRQHSTGARSVIIQGGQLSVPGGGLSE